MTVTSDLVEAYLKCPTTCFLLSHEEVGTGNAYAEWTRTKSASFPSEGIQRLVADSRRRPYSRCVFSRHSRHIWTRAAQAFTTDAVRTIAGEPVLTTR